MLIGLCCHTLLVCIILPVDRVVLPYNVGCVHLLHVDRVVLPYNVGV